MTLQVHVEVTWNSFYLPCRKLVANVVSQLPRTLFDQTWVCTLFFHSDLIAKLMLCDIVISSA